jgi:GntR family transcriptional regulator
LNPQTSTPQDEARPIALPAKEIDRTVPVALYYQVAELLEEEIRSRGSEPGGRLPSEPAMCDHFRVSRATVRQALARLEQRGLVTRRAGRGTFVQHQQPGLWLLQRSEGLFQVEVDRLGRTVSSKILRADLGVLPAWACDALDLPNGSEGATLERLRFLDNRVALYVVNHVPAQFAKTALMTENASESLYRRLEEREGLTPSGGRRTLDAVSADARTAKLLELEQGAPVVFIESVTWDNEQEPFDCYRAWLRTDRLRIEIEVGSTSKSDKVERVDSGLPGDTHFALRD